MGILGNWGYGVDSSDACTCNDTVPAVPQWHFLKGKACCRDRTSTRAVCACFSSVL